MTRLEFEKSLTKVWETSQANSDEGIRRRRMSAYIGALEAKLVANTKPEDWKRISEELESGVMVRMKNIV